MTGSWWCPMRPTPRWSRRPSRSAWPASTRRLDDASDRTALIAVQGPRGPAHPGAAHGRGPRRAALLRLAAGTRGGRAGLGRPDRLHRRGRLRGVPGATRMPCRCGMRCWRGPPTATCCPAAWAPGTRSGWRPGMPLYGNELDRDCTPAEAGLGRVVKLDKPGGFVGREALAAATRRRSSQGRWSGLDPPRAGHRPARLPGLPPGTAADADRRRHQRQPVADAGRRDRDGAGCRPTPASVGTMVQVGIRASRVAAEVVALPFYRRPG